MAMLKIIAIIIMMMMTAMVVIGKKTSWNLSVRTVPPPLDGKNALKKHFPPTDGLVLKRVN